MSTEAILSDTVAAPIGAYSQAIRAGDLLFVSGQVAMDADGAVVGVGDIEVQARTVFHNLGEVLAAAGAGPQHVVQLTIFVVGMSHRPAVAAARRAWVQEPYPASSLVGVSELALPDLLIEVEAIAVLGPNGGGARA